MKKMSTKLTVGVVLIIAITLVAIAIPSYNVIMSENNHTVTEQLSKRVDGARDMAVMLNANEESSKAKEMFRAYIVERKVGTDGYGFAVDSNGTAIFHPDPNVQGTDLSQEYFVQEMLENKGYFTEGESDQVRVVDYTWKGEKKFAYYTYLKDWDIFIALSGYYNDFNAVQHKALSVLIGVGILIMVLASIIVFLITKVAVKPILDLAGAMKEVEQGNLRMNPMKNKSKDEIGILIDGFNGMLTTLQELTNNIKDSTSILDESLKSTKESVEQTVEASEEVTNAIGQIATGNTALATEIEKGNFSMKAISNSADETNDSAVKMNETIEKVNSYVQEGATTTKDLIEKSEESKKALYAIYNKVENLEEESDKITGVTDMIRSIAEQTNLLSLNAAIESARAGELGRGFAVVAGEIRNLANQSSEQTDTISSLVTHIQNEIQEIVKTVKDSEETFMAQSQAVEQTRKIFQGIESMMNHMIENITLVTERISHISENTNTMVDMVEGISATSEETTASAQEVNALTEEQNASIQAMKDSMDQLYELSMNLKVLVERFKTE